MKKLIYLKHFNKKMIFRINLMMIYSKKMKKVKLKLWTYRNNMKKKFLNLENNSMIKNLNQEIFN